MFHAQYTIGTYALDCMLIVNLVEVECGWQCDSNWRKEAMKLLPKSGLIDAESPALCCPLYMALPASYLKTVVLDYLELANRL